MVGIYPKSGFSANRIAFQSGRCRSLLHVRQLSFRSSPLKTAACRRDAVREQAAPDIS